MADMADDKEFLRLIPEDSTELLPKPQVEKLVFCSGQVYYALARAREANQLKNVAIARVEQISPFPFDLVQQQASAYPNAEIVWAQEEPMNMGAWSYVEPRIVTALKETETHKDKRPFYAGRDPTGSVATGNKKMHEQEEYSLLSEALLGEARKPKKVFFNF
jgi:2-oxoglutarate dehydrogenase E1 component